MLGLYRRIYLDDQKHVGRKFFLLWVFFLLIFAVPWLTSFTGSIKVTGQVLDQHGKPVSDAKAMISVLALSADSMPFIGFPKEANVMHTELQVGPDGRFEFTANLWRITRLGIHFESKLGYIEPRQWYPDSGIRFLVMGQQYGSKEKPLIFLAHWDEESSR